MFYQAPRISYSIRRDTMKNIDLSIIHLSIIYMLLIFPLLIFIIFRINLLKKTAISVVRMSIQLALVGIYLKFIFDLNSLWVNVLWIGIMITVANFNILDSAGLNKKKFFSLTLIGISISTLLTTSIIVFVALQPQPFYDARYFIPISGMILGNCMRSNVISLERFYSTIKKNEKEFFTYLQLGASLDEACAPYFRQALVAALMPALSVMATMGIVSLPGMMTGQILGGASPLVAIKYQIAIMIAIFSSVTLSSTLNIIISKRSTFNDYHILRNDVFSKKGK